MALDRPEEGMVRVARIGKPHGIRGDVTVQIFTDSPETRFSPGSQVVVVKAKNAAESKTALHPILTIKEARWNKKILLLSFEEITDRNQAELHRNVELYAQAEDTSEDDDSWYADDLKGFTVYRDSSSGQVLGTVTDLIIGDFQDLLEIEMSNGEQALVPFVDEFIPSIDQEARILVLTPPDGLLEINTGTGQ